MELFFVYLIKSSLILFLGTTIFMLLLRYETFHRLNRWLLLGIMFMSFVLPLVNIGYDSPLSHIIETVVKGDGGKQFVEYDTGTYNILDDISVAEDYELSEKGIQESGIFEYITFRQWIAIIYFLFAGLLVFRFLYMYSQVIHILRKGETLHYTFADGKNVALRLHNADYAPFSWFGYICMPCRELNESADDIIIHELAHVKNYHSCDILLADMLIIMQWFNPMTWVLKALLKDIHEYEADEAVISAGIDAKRYQLLIIKKAVGARLYSIANSFNHSLTKKRITMMCKKKSSLWHSAKALYVVPLAIVAVCTFSSSMNNGEVSDKVSEKTEFYKGDGENIPPVASVLSNVADSDSVVIFNVKETDIYQVVELQPEFPGGMSELMKYLRHNMKYPEEAMQKGIQGKTFVAFVVGKDGSVNNVEVVKSSGSELLDAEAVRVVSTMPKWKPGEQHGEAVNVRFTLPLYFAIQGLKKNSVSTETQKADLAEATVITNPKRSDESGESVFQIVELQPEFPGGMSELMKYLRHNMKYPEEAMQKGIQGKTFVAFVVGKDGSVNNVEVVKSSGSELLDAEAVRVVSTMPKWKPGEQHGKAVNVRITLPLYFAIQGSKKCSVSVEGIDGEFI